MTQATAQTTAVALQDPVQEEITTMMTTIVLHLAAEMMGTVLAASVVHALKITTLIIARIVHRDVVIRDGIRGKTGIGITISRHPSSTFTHKVPRASRHALRKTSLTVRRS